MSDLEKFRKPIFYAFLGFPHARLEFSPSADLPSPAGGDKVIVFYFYSNNDNNNNNNSL